MDFGFPVPQTDRARARLLQLAPHDVEPFAAISALDDLPSQPFIKPGRHIGSVEIDDGVTQVARMGFDRADERLPESAASMVGFHEQRPQIRLVRRAILGLGFVQANRADDFTVGDGNEGRWESGLIEMGVQPARDGFERSIRL